MLSQKEQFEREADDTDRLLFQALSGLDRLSQLAPSKDYQGRISEAKWLIRDARVFVRNFMNEKRRAETSA